MVLVLACFDPLWPNLIFAVAKFGQAIGTMAPTGTAKSRSGHYSVRLETRLLVSQFRRCVISGEERKGSGLLRKYSASRSVSAEWIVSAICSFF